MRLNFRQGIVSHQSGGFLDINPSGNVDILANNRPVRVTLAQDSSNYLHTEDNSVPNAWVGPFSVSVDYWLYWDFNRLTFERTFGYTELEPVAQSTPPGNGNATIQSVIAGGPGIGAFIVDEHFPLQTDRTVIVTGSTGNDGTYTVASTVFDGFAGTTTIIVNETVSSAVADGTLNLDFDSKGIPLLTVDRHWYDTFNNRHYVWSGTAWTEVIRVFAAQLQNNTTFFPQSTAIGVFTGTQVGNTSEIRAGRVLFDEASNTIIRDGGTFFTTEDQMFAGGSRVDAVRLESNVARAQFIDAAASAYSVVSFTTDGKIQTAEYDDTGSTVVGLVTIDVLLNEIPSVVLQGVVTNPAWDWTASVPVGSPLWVENGLLTTVDPHVSDVITYPQGRVPVARVLDQNTVIFEQGLGGKGETGPAGAAATLIPATTSSLGGVTLTVPSSSPTLALVPSDLDPRLSDARTPLAHTHIASDITLTPGSGVTSNNVQSGILELGAGKVNRSGDTMTGALTLPGNPTSTLQAATKGYVDGLVLGIAWVSPISFVNLISDNLNTPPGSPNYSDVYIVASGGTGLWTGLDGRVVQWDGAVWIDHGLLSSYATGTRFGVSMETPTPASGIFAGSDDYIFTLTNPATGTFDGGFLPPTNTGVFVNNGASLHAFHQYVYNGTQWIELGGGTAITVDDTTIVQSGNIISTKTFAAGGTVDAATYRGVDAATLFAAISHGHAGSNITLTAPYAGTDWGTPTIVNDDQLTAATVDIALQELFDKKANKQQVYSDISDLPVAANVPGMVVEVTSVGGIVCDEEDDFNRPDEDLDASALWDEYPPGFAVSKTKIVSGAVTHTVDGSQAGTSPVYAISLATKTFTKPYFASADLVSLPAPGENHLGLAVTCSDVFGVSNSALGVFPKADGGLELYSKAFGSEVFQGATAAGVISPGDNLAIHIDAADLVTVYVNGVSVFSATISVFLITDQPGFSGRTADITTTPAIFDNFCAGEGAFVIEPPGGTLYVSRNNAWVPIPLLPASTAECSMLVGNDKGGWKESVHYEFPQPYDLASFIQGGTTDSTNIFKFVTTRPFRMYEYGHQLHADVSPTSGTAQITASKNGSPVGFFDITDAGLYSFNMQITNDDLGRVIDFAVGDRLTLNTNLNTAGMEDVGLSLRGFAVPTVSCPGVEITFASSPASPLLLGGPTGTLTAGVDFTITGSVTHLEWSVAALSPDIDYFAVWETLDNNSYDNSNSGVTFTNGANVTNVNSESKYHSTTGDVASIDVSENNGSALYYKLRVVGFGPGGLTTAHTIIKFDP